MTWKSSDRSIGGYRMKKAKKKSKKKAKKARVDPAKPVFSSWLAEVSPGVISPSTRTGDPGGAWRYSIVLSDQNCLSVSHGACVAPVVYLLDAFDVVSRQHIFGDTDTFPFSPSLSLVAVPQLQRRAGALDLALERAPRPRRAAWRPARKRPCASRQRLGGGAPRPPPQRL